MSPTNLLQALMKEATEYRSKSTALNPLAWIIGLLLAAAMSAITIDKDYWMCMVLCILVIIAIVLFFVVYVYFVFTDKDALRSEKFVISKKVIDSFVMGDDTQGLLEPKDIIKLVVESPTVDQSSKVKP